MRILNTVRAREMVRAEDALNIDHFEADTILGLNANMVTGQLGLIRPTGPKKAKEDSLSRMMDEQKTHDAEKAFEHMSIKA